MSFSFKPSTALTTAQTVPSFSFSSAPASTPQAPATQSFGFGSTPVQPAAQGTTGTGLFGSQSQPTQQPASQTGTSLFGSTPGATSLFGSKPAQPASTTSASGTSGSLFGGGSSLFGQPQNQVQTTQPTGMFGQQQPQAAGQQSTSLFGQSQPQQQTGLFGAAQPQAQQQQQTSLFGQPQQQQQTNMVGQPQQPQTSMFGQPQPQQQQQQTGIFGQPKPQGLFGQQSTINNSLFGQTPASQQSITLQSSTTAGPSSGISRTTKFSDLPEPVQKTIEQMDAWIKDQKQIGASIDTENIGRAIWQTSGDIKAANDEHAAIAQGLTSLKHSLEQLAAKVSSEAQDLQKLLETWEAAKPADARNNGVIRPIAHRDFPQEFFSRVAESLYERVTRYRRTIAELTRAVTSLAHDHDGLTPQVIAQTIQNHQQAVLSLAAQLEGLQLRMNDLRASYTQEFRERTNTMRDPFDVAREEKGVSTLRA